MSALGRPEQSGEHTLYQLLLERRDALLEYIRRKIPPRLQLAIVADDVLQNTWVAAFRATGGAVPRVPNFDQWLMAMAEHKLIDAMRREEAQCRGGPNAAPHAGLSALAESLRAPTRSPERAAADGEIVEAVRAQVYRLPPDLRDVIVLHYLEGRTLRQVAGQLQMDLDKVRYRLKCGRDLLRQGLGRAGNYYSDVPTGEAPLRRFAEPL